MVDWLAMLLCFQRTAFASGTISCTTTSSRTYTSGTRASLLACPCTQSTRGHIHTHAHTHTCTRARSRTRTHRHIFLDTPYRYSRIVCIRRAHNPFNMLGLMCCVCLQGRHYSAAQIRHCIHQSDVQQEPRVPDGCCTAHHVLSVCAAGVVLGCLSHSHSFSRTHTHTATPSHTRTLLLHHAQLF